MSRLNDYERGKIRTDRGEIIDKGNWGFDPVHPDYNDGADPSGTKDAYESFRLADVDAAAAGMSLAPTPGTYKIGTNLTLSAGFRPVEGVYIQPASGVTVTFNGPVSAGLWQWIDNSAGGSVVFGTKNKQVYAEWFGAGDAGSVDDRIGINRAITAAPSGGEVLLGSVAYSFDGGGASDGIISLKSNVTLRSGRPGQYAKISVSNTHASYGAINLDRVDNVTLQDLHVYGDAVITSEGVVGTASTILGSVVNIGDSTRVTVKHCYVENTVGNTSQGNAFNFNGGHSHVLHDIRSRYTNDVVNIRASSVTVDGFDFEHILQAPGGGVATNATIYIVAGRRHQISILNGRIRWCETGIDVGTTARGVYVENVHIEGASKQAFLCKDQCQSVVFHNCSHTRLRQATGDFVVTAGGGNVIPSATRDIHFTDCVSHARPVPIEVLTVSAAAAGATSITVNRLLGQKDHLGVLIPSGASFVLDGVTVTTTADVLFQEASVGSSQTIPCNALSGPIANSSSVTYQRDAFPGVGFDIQGGKHGKIKNCEVYGGSNAIRLQSTSADGVTVSDARLVEHWDIEGCTIEVAEVPGATNWYGVNIIHARFINSRSNTFLGPGRATNNRHGYHLDQIGGTVTPLAAFHANIGEGDRFVNLWNPFLSDGNVDFVRVGRHFVHDVERVFYLLDSTTDANWLAEETVVESRSPTTPAIPTYVQVVGTPDYFAQNLVFKGQRLAYNSDVVEVASATVFLTYRGHTIRVTSAGTIGDPNTSVFEPYKRITIVNASGGIVDVPHGGAYRTRTGATVSLAAGQAMALVYTATGTWAEA